VHKKSVEVVTNRARRRRVRIGLAVGTGVAALVAVPLGASALTSSTTAGQIKACYPTGTGLKVMNHIATSSACPTGYSSLTWNKVGPQGPQGVQGPAGISVGASGTSATSVPLDTAQTLTPVLSTAAAPQGGTHYVNASVMLVVAQGDTVVCVMSGANGESGAFSTVGPVANQTYETLPLSQNVALNAGGSATVECTDYTSNAATSFYDGGITATLTNSSTGNAPQMSPQEARPALPPRL
jgi:hypothetical protein